MIFHELASDNMFAIPDFWYHTVAYPGESPTIFVETIPALQLFLFQCPYVLEKIYVIEYI